MHTCNIAISVVLMYQHVLCPVNNEERNSLPVELFENAM